MLHLAAVSTAAAAAGSAAALPNVIFVLSDDIGWSDVGYIATDAALQHQPGAGNRRFKVNPARTPNLDALAAGPHTMIFDRFYAGSGVCSPTRAAMLTGRTPNRECITGAEGCGQAPAWSCADKLPLPPPTFTVAEAAKAAGMATIHIGKWHLGDFWQKGLKHRGVPTLNNGEGSSSWEQMDITDPANARVLGAYAYNKWPVSNPGVHGFDEWHSTEASASSTSCNCACEPAWVAGGCIDGGGAWTKGTTSYKCTNYWDPTDLTPDAHAPSRTECRNVTAPRDCVANMTSKIGASRVAPDTGDDTEHVLNVFEDFLDRKVGKANATAPGPEKAPAFFAALWLHTNHEPHPALPQFYHAYNDTYGNPAGDYLGTLTQMDSNFARLQAMLADRGIAENTMLVFTADNGPHEGVTDVRASTNGLRQCKASLYEGGIRVPGFITWPAVIKQNARTSHPAGVYDLLPTVLEAIGVPHEHPDWATDGMSLLPLLRGDTPAAAPRPADKPLCFELGGQAACVDNQWKLVRDGVEGQCKWNDLVKGKAVPPPYTKAGKGTFLFDLSSDPTESVPLNEAQAAKYASMVAYMDTWLAGVKASQINESTCMPASPTPAPAPPTPPPAPTPHFELQQGADVCLSGGTIGQHTDLVVSACGQLGGDSVDWTTRDDTLWNTADSSLAPKVDQEDHKGNYCIVGNEIFFGKVDKSESNRFVVSVVPVPPPTPEPTPSPTLTPSSNGGQPVLVAHAYCENMCLAMTVDKKIQLDYCNATTATGWLMAMKVWGDSDSFLGYIS